MTPRIARSHHAAIAFLAGAVLTLTSCSDPQSAVESGDGLGFVSGGGTSTTIASEDRTAAPQVSGVTLEGDSLSLSDYDGKVVVVNVWGSWCGPCREEAEILQEVAQQTASDGVQFVGLNTRDQSAGALAFQRTFHITYPSLVDDDGQLQLAFRDSLPPNAVPSTLVLDTQGRVAARVIGATTFSQLSHLVADVVAER